MKVIKCRYNFQAVKSWPPVDTLDGAYLGHPYIILILPVSSYLLPHGIDECYYSWVSGHYVRPEVNQVLRSLLLSAHHLIFTLVLQIDLITSIYTLISMANIETYSETFLYGGDHLWDWSNMVTL